MSEVTRAIATLGSEEKAVNRFLEKTYSLVLIRLKEKYEVLVGSYRCGSQPFS